MRTSHPAVTLERPHIAIHDEVTLRFALDRDYPVLYEPLWQSRLLDVKGCSLVQAFVGFRIVDDDGPDPFEGLYFAGRLVGSYSSAGVALSPLVTASTEFGGQVGINSRGSYGFPVMTASDNLATQYRFQFLGYAGGRPPGQAYRVIRIAFDGMLVAGTRTRARQR